MDLEDELQDLVNAFVADVTRIARRKAMATIAELLANVELPAGGGRAPRARAARGSTSGTEAAPRKARGAKRSSADLDALKDRVRAHVREHPGQRVTELNAALATTTAELRRPLAQLIAAGELRTTGQKRATQYFAA